MSAAAAQLVRLLHEDIVNPDEHQLSKSALIAGLQCPARLWGQKNHPQYAVKTAVGIKEQGTLVGKAAQQAFPDGVLIDIPSYHREEAVAATKVAMNDPKVSVIFEAAFYYLGLIVRVDVLIRKDSGWSSVTCPSDYGDYVVGEVKASTQVKKHHIWDASFQAFVMRREGINVTDVTVMHLDRHGRDTEITCDVRAYVDARTYANRGDGYVWDGAMNADGTPKYNFAQMFVCVPIEPLPDSQLIAVVNPLLVILGQPTAPKVTVGAHCSKPYDCEFKEHCYKGIPTDDLAYMPNATLGAGRWAPVATLRDQGINSIRDIDSSKFEFKYREKIDRVQKAFTLGGVVVDSKLFREQVSKLVYPFNFCDYETVSYALPNLANTKPWDAIAMQLSNDRYEADGTVTHQEFLAEADGSDPRVPFIEALLAAVGTEGTIITYSMYEFTNVNEPLAQQYPQYAERLRALKDRAWDLCAVVRSTTYHPEFRGSFSIKDVLPALVPDMSYEGMAIANGLAVAPAWDRLLHDKSMTPAERSELRTNLLDYCGQDTMAMVRVLGVLVGL